MLVRLTAIEQSDIALFEFDFDLTFAVFFMNADEQIYGRYGGRDARNADARQSLAGLKYAMQAALDTHGKTVRDEPRDRRPPMFVRDLAAARRQRGCVHCHQVKEFLHAELKARGKWSHEFAFRYPPPDNLGVDLEVDRGNIVARVEPNSPAERTGLKKGDAIQQLNNISVRSFADAQFALDRAPLTGEVSVRWQRDGKTLGGQIELPAGWRRSDISWRNSLSAMLPSARLYGDDLTADERQSYELTDKQLAFRQKESVHAQAKAAGIRPGDIILGFDSKKLETDSYGFLTYVRGHYVAGERVTVNLIRNGKRMSLPMLLLPF